MRTRLRMVRVTTRPVQVRETAAVDLPQSADAVWSFMWEPASCLKLFDTAEVAVSLPGGEGIGEIQAFVERTAGGRVGVLHEVIELDHGRRAVTRSLVSWCPSWGAVTVEALGPDSCRLTQTFWADVPAGVPPATEKQMRDEFRQRLEPMMHRLAEWAVGRLG